MTVDKKKSGKIQDTETTIEKVGEPKLFKNAPCNVGCSAKMTKNLGNYESVTFAVDIHIPCLHNEIDATFAFASNWVDEKMTALVADTLEEPTTEDDPFV